MMNNLFLSSLKYVFILLLCVFVLRLFVGVSYFSFSELIDFITNCPNYFDKVYSALGGYEKFEHTPNMFENLSGLGSFFTFFSNVINVLKYVFSALVSAIGYLFYFVTFI